MTDPITAATTGPTAGTALHDAPGPRPTDIATAMRGPVAPRDTARLVRHPLPATAVRLDPDGHLGRWQHLNADATLPHCLRMLEESGAMDNLRRLVGESDAPHVGFMFADTDVYKTAEAIGWEIARTGTERYDEWLTGTADLLRRVQQPDGYLQSHVQGTRPGDQFADLRWEHEMYCTGHLVQAAVALHRACGRTDWLAVARRAADLLVERFGPDGAAGYDGHPEVETALVELYRETGHRPYLNTAARIVDERGQHLRLLGPDRLGAHYFQDHAPVREAREATGHAVRQLYLDTGVADLVTEVGDRALMSALVDRWTSAHTQKMYLTGAMGSRHFDESFGDPYELPPDRAYAETCAAVADIQLSYRLLLLTGHHRYADAMERALLNAVAASVSADGTAFFYSDPLHLREGHREEENAPSRRTPWYSCACCPPNIARLVASVHAYLATTSEDILWLHLPAALTVDLPSSVGTGTLTARTGYPADGRIDLEVEGTLTGTVAVRLPGWADPGGVRAVADGAALGAGAVRDGYLLLGPGTRCARIDLPMAPVLVTVHPRVDAVRGQIAVQRGPVVYCLEQADHDVPVEDLRLRADTAWTVLPPDRPGALPRLSADGVHVDPAGVGLYAPLGSPQPDGRPVRLTAVPYATWGNRSPGPMRVWVPLA